MAIFPTITADTTAIWVTFWNVTFQNYLATLATGGSSFAPELLGNGRIAALDKTLLAPAATNALAITLKSGARYIMGGVLKTLDGDITIANVPPNKTNGTYGVLSVAVVGGNDAWSVIWTDIKPAAGSGIIGRVVTDATKVVSIDLADEDIIQPEWVENARLRALEAQIATLGGLPVEGSPSGVTVAQFNALAQRVLDLETWKATVPQLISDAKAELRAYIDSGIDLSEELVMQLPDEHFNETVMRLLTGIVDTNPHAAERIEAALVQFGLYGHSLSGLGTDAGIDDTPNYLRYTSVPLDVPNRGLGG